MQPTWYIGETVVENVNVGVIISDPFLNLKLDKANKLADDAAKMAARGCTDSGDFHRYMALSTLWFKVAKVFVSVLALWPRPLGPGP